MLRYELGETDLGDVRFGISPLTELGLSVRTIREPSRYPLQLPWLARTEAARAELDHEVLNALVDGRLWTPDFLNPRPASPLTRIDDELDTLRAIDAEVFRRQLRVVHGELPVVFAGPPRAAIDRMVDALDHYWRLCFAPYWPRMRAILEADIVYRGRQIAQGGLATMLNGLSSGVSFDGRALEVRLATSNPGTVPVGTGGLTLAPTMFTKRASAPIDADAPALVLYPARGQGAMWEGERVANPDALAAVVGQARASLLVALAVPASSTELGIRFGVSASAVNQQLRMLRDAGLVTTARSGHSVLYFRSALGDELLGAGAVN